jgi:hypothetical protein
MQALPILAASSGATEIVEKRANQSGQEYRLTAKLLLLQLSDYLLAVNKNKNSGTAFKRSRVSFLSRLTEFLTQPLNNRSGVVFDL